MERLLNKARQFQVVPAAAPLHAKSPHAAARHDGNVGARQTPRVSGTAPILAHTSALGQIENLTGRLALHRPTQTRQGSAQNPATSHHVSARTDTDSSTVSRIIALGSAPSSPRLSRPAAVPRVKAKALLCLDCSSNEVLLDQNSTQPLPIASITKLVTAMVVIDDMNLDEVCEAPQDIRKIEKHVVGIRPGDRITTRDLLHGLLIESGNDCAETLARSYPKGGRSGFLAAMNQKARELGAVHTRFYTPSGLDVKIRSANAAAEDQIAKLSNTASAQDVALIARKAFSYPLIRQIARMKTYTFRTLNPKPREYKLVSNDKLLERGLPVEGAKTGYTDAAGKCIVALFKDHGKERLIVVLNTQRHFNAAEKIYRWASQQ
ncbi:MAG: D-alanyl-D-alanine carboxypeptidase family protein [Desulfomonilaceae bacterium]